MKLLLNSSKLREFVGARLGVLVSLAQPSLPEDGSEMVVVVGLCAAVEGGESPNSDLKDFGLPTPDWVSTVKSVQQHFPAGCSVSGMWVKVQDDKLESVVSLLIEKTKLNDVFNGPVLVVSCSPEETTPPVVKAYTCSAAVPSSPLELTPVEWVKPSDMSVGRYLSQQTAMLRVCASLPLCLTTTRDRPIGRLVQKVQSQSSVFMLSSRQVLFDETSSQTLKTVLSERFKVSSKSGSSVTLMAHVQGKPVIVELLESAVAEQTTELPVAPTLTFSAPVKEGCVQLSIPVDSLGLVRWDTTLGEIAVSLKASICAQLEAIKKEMTWKANMIHSVSIHHFSLSTQDTPVTIAYPDMPLAQLSQDGVEPPTSLTNQQLQPRQAVWQGMFGLSPKSSQLRILSRTSVGTDLDWIASNNIRCQGPQLLNPHLTVKCTGVVGGTRRVVQGSYLYYHYTQDGFDDTGWGCAYRSLQTLWSWFLLQGYTEKPVPRHREIQETLVRVGDKEQSFLGSKEWIGSFEVSTVLNQLLGIESKIHYTSSGAEMVSAGRVLLSHFLTEGTPVMIGGGVLAQTILGVDFCTATGEIQFLVLDPHFTGRDELKTVLEKGMCAWKPVTFWESSAHYNMCLPLVPSAS